VSDSLSKYCQSRHCIALCGPLVLLMFCCTGCLMVPIPTPEHQKDDLPGRTNVSKESIESLKPGITTRLEVLQRLGSPDGVFDNDRTFVYLWSKSAGYFLWAVFSQVQAAGGLETVGAGHALIIRFDDAGALVSHEAATKNNWIGWGGPRVDRTVFPEAIRHAEQAPTTMPSPTGK